MARDGLKDFCKGQNFMSLKIWNLNQIKSEKKTFRKSIVYKYLNFIIKKGFLKFCLIRLVVLSDMLKF